jgi:NTP pyrophosphatase (non-canonical NTP hydrolase)
MKIDLNETTENIKEWAIERNLHTAEPSKQMLKLGEEFGELCQAIAKGRKKAAVKDAIGDMYVVLTILSMQLNIDIEDCILAAYDEIRDRKGKMINGVFIKQADIGEG